MWRVGQGLVDAIMVGASDVEARPKQNKKKLHVEMLTGLPLVHGLG